MYWAEWIPYFPFKSQCHTSKQNPIGSARRCYKLFFYKILQKDSWIPLSQEPSAAWAHKIWRGLGCHGMLPVALSALLFRRSAVSRRCGRTMLQIESTSNGLTNIHQHVFFVVSAWEGSAQSFYRTYLPSLQTIWNRHHLHLYPMCFETLSASFPRGHDRETTSKKQWSLTLLLVLQWLNQLSNSIYLLDPSCIHRFLVKHQSKTFKS